MKDTQTQLKYIAFGVSALFLLGASVFFSACTGVSEDEAQQREMIAAGGASFQAYCAGCHGLDAKGDGPTAQYMTIEPSDLTRISARYGRFPAGVVYSRIDGAQQDTSMATMQMPHWGRIWRGSDPQSGDREVTHKRIQEIVEYVRSVQSE